MPTFTLSDLIAWSEKLPLWQRDALRRILTGKLTDMDVADLARMAKVGQGLAIPGQNPPVPAGLEHIPTASNSKSHVALLGVRDIAHVNALAAGPLTFAAEGLTIIYGDNASGKSGISRILKKAAHARQPGGPILPSVFEPDPGTPARATIDFRVGTVDHSYQWIDGAPKNGMLAQVNVFDTDCAKVEIEESNRLAYTPEILRVFQELAAVCQRVAANLKEERTQLDRDRPPEIDLLRLRPTTAASQFVTNLSAKTMPAEVDALCAVSDENRERLADLTRALRDDPSGQAGLLEARVRLLTDIDKLNLNIERMLSEAALQDFQERLAAVHATSEAAKSAREAFASQSSLKGIGSSAWTELWESARRYSQMFAYPKDNFPLTAEGSLCVLCQQPIETDAAQRLRNFEQFVQDDVQQRSERARKHLSELTTEVQALRIPSSVTLQRDAAVRGTTAGDSTKRFVVVAKLRRRYMLRTPLGKAPISPPALPQRPDLKSLCGSVEEEGTRLRAAANSEAREKMQTELGELDDRAKIEPLKIAMKKEIARLRYCTILDKAREDCDTTWITRKAGEVAKIIIRCAGRYPAR